MTRFALLTFVLTLLLTAPAAAQPSSKEPAPAASPAATPAAPDVSPTPVATPEMTPPPPQPTPPPATPVPVMTATPEPTPYDFTGPMPGMPPGSRKMRGAFSLGAHFFLGSGWNEEEETPGEGPPQTEEYIAGSGKLELLYDLGPNHAGAMFVGAHNGSHSVEEGVGPETRTTSLTLVYAGIGARLQTPAAKIGFYAQGNLGVGLASLRNTVTLNNGGEEEEIESDQELSPAGVGAISLGTSFHVARGLDAFAELRYMRAPVRFDDGDPIEMGGAAAFAGFSLRL